MARSPASIHSLAAWRDGKTGVKEEGKPDKSWLPVKREEERPKSPLAREVGVVDIEEEGKYSSSSRAHREKQGSGAAPGVRAKVTERR